MMPEDVRRPSGDAALTLLDSLFVHLQESGVISDVGRDEIFDAAISAHEVADEEDPNPTHRATAELLRRLKTRSDSVRVVGDHATRAAQAS